MSAAIYFVSGIDTEIGKTYATGYLAKLWTEQGQRVITQKLVQTGNIDISEDIQKHREIMGMGWFQEDHEKLTMPEIFTYPASPHLATRLDGRDLDFAKIEAATNELAQRFDPEKVMLIEKFDPEKIITAVYLDNDKMQYNVKRFRIETTTLKTEFLFIKEGKGNLGAFWIPPNTGSKFLIILLN